MRLKHYDHDGRARFITFGTHRRLRVLDDPDIRDLAERDLLLSCKTEHVELLAYVIMPDHMHFVIVPPVTTQVGLFVGAYKRQSAKSILSQFRNSNDAILGSLIVNRDGNQKLAVWQRRCFDRNCRDDGEVRGVVEYCHFNPVASKLANEPGDWKWSSYRWYPDD